MKDKNKLKVGVLSLGCPRNLVDSELILSRLNLKNYKLVQLKDAQVAIVNTCCFIKEAKEESIEAILDLVDLKNKGIIKKIIVYGCLPQRYGEELASSLKEVDAFVGRISLNHTARKLHLTPRHYSYLKICEGCLNSCSFCIIPHIKGRFSSRSINSLVQEAVCLEERGVKEINIIGQDVTLYGKDLARRIDLVTFLKALLKNTKDIRWVRLLYLYPSRITDELLDLIKNEPRICKYIDLPIQHINDRILRLMRRDTTKNDILRLIRKIRTKIPEAAIRTTLMVGFPTETEEEFDELLNFVQETRLERLGVFTYSKEEGTPAYDLSGQITEGIKRRRLGVLMSKQQTVSKEINEGFLNEVMDVLVDDCQDGNYLARSQHDAPEVDGLVFLKSNTPLKVGQFKKVRITDTLEYDLVGEPV
jgi:ribosomal protein S12 methylthiotransferase